MRFVAEPDPSGRNAWRLMCHISALGHGEAKVISVRRFQTGPGFRTEAKAADWSSRLNRMAERAWDKGF